MHLSVGIAAPCVFEMSAPRKKVYPGDGKQLILTACAVRESFYSSWANFFPVGPTCTSECLEPCRTLAS